MFDNIGGKIKGLAKLSCWIGIAASVIGAIIIWSLDTGWNGSGYYVLPGILVLIVGSLVSWISSFFVYGFGELVDKACEIARNTSNGETKSEPQPKVDTERISKIEKLRSQGLITEEEYQQAVLNVQ